MQSTPHTLSIEIPSVSHMCDRTKDSPANILILYNPYNLCSFLKPIISSGGRLSNLKFWLAVTYRPEWKMRRVDSAIAELLVKSTGAISTPKITGVLKLQ